MGIIMGIVRGYHAHVYFDWSRLAKAIRLRERFSRTFPNPVGHVHSHPIGPHTKGMFQILINQSEFGAAVPWLLQHRDGLDVLVHEDTGNDLRDHTDGALWLGQSLPLNFEAMVA